MSQLLALYDIDDLRVESATNRELDSVCSCETEHFGEIRRVLEARKQSEATSPKCGQEFELCVAEFANDLRRERHFHTIGAEAKSACCPNRGKRHPPPSVKERILPRLREVWTI